MVVFYNPYRIVLFSNVFGMISHWYYHVHSSSPRHVCRLLPRNCCKSVIAHWIPCGDKYWWGRQVCTSDLKLNFFRHFTRLKIKKHFYIDHMGQYILKDQNLHLGSQFKINVWDWSASMRSNHVKKWTRNSMDRYDSFIVIVQLWF